MINIKDKEASLKLYVSTTLKSRPKYKEYKTKVNTSNRMYVTIMIVSIFLSAVGISAIAEANIVIASQYRIYVMWVGLFAGLFVGYNITRTQQELFTYIKELKSKWYILSSDKGLLWLASIILDIALMTYGSIATYQIKLDLQFKELNLPVIESQRKDAFSKRALLDEFIKDKRAEKLNLESNKFDREGLKKSREAKILELKKSIDDWRAKELKRIRRFWHYDGGTSIYGSEKKAKEACTRKYNRKMLQVPKLESKLLKQEALILKDVKAQKKSNEDKIQKVNEELSKLYAQKESIIIPSLSPPNQKVSSKNIIQTALVAMAVSIFLSNIHAWHLETIRVLDGYEAQQRTFLTNQYMSDREVEEVEEVEEVTVIHPIEEQNSKDDSEEEAEEVIEKRVEEVERVELSDDEILLNIVNKHKGDISFNDLVSESKLSRPTVKRFYKRQQSL